MCIETIHDLLHCNWILVLSYFSINLKHLSARGSQTLQSFLPQNTYYHEIYHPHDLLGWDNFVERRISKLYLCLHMVRSFADILGKVSMNKTVHYKLTPHKSLAIDFLELICKFQGRREETS